MSNEQQAQDLLDESLSAFMDGEASELELRRALKLDDESRQKWSRYHLASFAMREDFQLVKPIDVSAAVSAAIDAEPLLNQPAVSKGKLWGNIGRFGIAASVAGAIVLGVQLSNTGTEVNVAENNTATKSSNPILGSGTSVRVVGQQAIVKPAEEDKLKQEALKNNDGESTLK